MQWQKGSWKYVFAISSVPTGRAHSILSYHNEHLVQVGIRLKDAEYGFQSCVKQ